MRVISLIIVVDRGGLRAYRVNETNTRGARLTLVTAFEIPELDGEARTDHAMPRSDLPELEAEADRRICRQLAEEIARVVRQVGPDAGWSLAAARPIFRELVASLPDDVASRIVEHVPSDLIKTPVADLAQHFRSLQSLA